LKNPGHPRVPIFDSGGRGTYISGTGPGRPGGCPEGEAMEFYPGGRNPGGQHTLMDGGAPAGEATRSRFSRLTERFLGRRRTYLVDPSYQVRSAIIAVLGMALLLVFAGALFPLMTVAPARLRARSGPALLAATASGEMRSVLYLVAVGLFFVAAVFAIEIIETHKTAGVVYKIMRGLRELEGGRWGARVTLRKHDNFKEMEEAFNAATRALRAECAK